MTATVYVVVGVLAAIATAWGAIKVARINSQSSPYKDMGERLDQTYERMDKQDGKISELQDAKREDRHRIDRLEEDQDVLVVELIAQDDWQESGAEPPPPAIGKKARAVLRKHGDERRADRVKRER